MWLTFFINDMTFVGNILNFKRCYSSLSEFLGFPRGLYLRFDTNFVTPKEKNMLKKCENVWVESGNFK